MLVIYLNLEEENQITKYETNRFCANDNYNYRHEIWKI